MFIILGSEYLIKFTFHYLIFVLELDLVLIKVH